MKAFKAAEEGIRMQIFALFEEIAASKFPPTTMEPPAVN
jgi:hypothetical protein